MEFHASAEPRARRPNVSFSRNLAEALCLRVAAGEPVVRICADPGMPAAQTVSRWARRREAFGQALRQAREASGWVYKKHPRVALREAEIEAAVTRVLARLCADEALTVVLKQFSQPPKREEAG